MFFIAVHSRSLHVPGRPSGYPGDNTLAVYMMSISNFSNVFKKPPDLRNF